MSDAERLESSMADRAAQSMCHRGTDTSEAPTRAQVVSRERSQNGQRPKLRRFTSRHILQCLPRGAAEILPRIRVAAVRRSVHQRPKRSCCLGIFRSAAERARPDAEQCSASQAQPFGGLLAPRKRLEQRKPCVFELRQFQAADAAGDELPLDGIQPRLPNRHDAFVEILQPLTPPGHADRAKPWVRGGRNHICERQVQGPERRESGPDIRRRCFERRQAVRVQPPISDSRRPLPPRPPGTP